MMNNSWFLWGYVILITVLFTGYAQGVRKAKLNGNLIKTVGLGIGGVALLGMLFLLGSKPNPTVLIVNVTMMSLCTAYCIMMAQKQARVEAIYESEKLSVLVCSAYRLPFVDALILPTSTHLRSLGGPSGILLTAGGKILEKEVAFASPANLDKVLFTGAGALGVGKLLHAVVFAPNDLHIDQSRLKKGLQAALLLARKDNAKSVGLAYAPLRGIAPKEAAQLYREAAKKYEDDFEKITVVLLDGRHEALFKEIFTTGS
jgi:hypothetical protein